MESSFDPEAAALASFVIQVNPNMVQALGGAIAFECVLTDIGIFDKNGSTSTSCAESQVSDNEWSLESVHQNNIQEPAIKKRRTFKREKKEDSTWWRKYLNPDMTLNMEVEPQGRVAKKFRRNFRVPYLMYKTKILAMAKDRWWPTWHDKKVDAFGRLICDLELKLLGALFVLANGSTQFTVSEFTDMSEEVHRVFFKTWLGHMASVKDEFIFFPRDDVGHKFIVDEYGSIGFPGCIGSVDCVHNHWLASKQWVATTDASGGKKMFRGSYLLCDGGYHRWPCLVFPMKSGAPGSPARKWSMLIESVRKDIEGTFGILKMRFRYLKDFNRMHSLRDVDNGFVTCCILHNMLLEEDGYLEADLEQNPIGMTATLRRMFGNVALDGLWNRHRDDTIDELMDMEEARHCPFEKIRLESKWRNVMEGLLNHYVFETAKGTTNTAAR
ncbi:Plant transposon protein [Fragilaria crotonensis]|nr:Plant transposon protein [Fragilaria crotonensis]